MRRASTGLLPGDLTYEALETQWMPLLRMFARWRIGMEHEDLLQELRIILFNAQGKYDPGRGVAFKTYLFRALLNRALKLRQQVNAVKARVPPGMLVSLDDVPEPVAEDEMGLLEALSGIQHGGVRELATLIVRGENTPTMRKLRGLTPRKTRAAMRSLEALLKGD